MPNTTIVIDIDEEAFKEMYACHKLELMGHWVSKDEKYDRDLFVMNLFEGIKEKLDNLKTEL